METIIKLIEKNFTITVLAFLGIVAPGILEIIVFDKNMFMDIEAIKLALLACSLSSISAGCFYIATRIFGNKDEEIKTSLSLSLAMNGTIVFFFLALKVISIPDMTIKCFIFLMVLSVVIYGVILAMDNKKEHRKVEKPEVGTRCQTEDSETEK